MDEGAPGRVRRGRDRALRDLEAREARRATIVAAIRARPGIHVRELMRQLDLSTSVAVGDLARLEWRGEIRTEWVQNRRCAYPVADVTSPA